MRVLMTALALLGGLGAVGGQRPEPPRGDGVFVASRQPASARLPAPTRATLRQRFTGIDFDVLETMRRGVQRSGGVPPALTLTLFDDVEVVALFDHTEPTSSGYVLSGTLVGEDLGVATFAVDRAAGVVAGSVRSARGTYRVLSTEAGDHVIEEIDPSVFAPRGNDAIVPPAAAPPPAPVRSEPIRVPRPAVPRPAVDPPVASSNHGRAMVDLLVVYTPNARRAHGGRSAIRGRINVAVAETNRAFVNSGVRIRLRVARMAELNYAEGGRGSLAILEHLQNPSDGYMDGVHGWRNRYRADIVHLIADWDSQADGTAGRGHQIWRPDQEEWAFSVAVEPEGSLFAHEIGHNMGLAHDRYQIGTEEYSVVENQQNDWVVGPYSFGYVNQWMFRSGVSRRDRWWTIMAYSTQCEDWAQDRGYSTYDHCWRGGAGRIMRFSNPARSWRGDRLGVPGEARTNDVMGPSDARRALNEVRFNVASWRRNGDGNRLVGGQRLRPGEFIQARSAACRLVFQTDGNLVAYHNGVGYWSSRTRGLGGGSAAVMESEGNFVVYDAAGVARWATGTDGNRGAYLGIQGDCNVVLRAAGGAGLWASGRP